MAVMLAQHLAPWPCFWHHGCVLGTTFGTAFGTCKVSAVMHPAKTHNVSGIQGRLVPQMWCHRGAKSGAKSLASMPKVVPKQIAPLKVPIVVPGDLQRQIESSHLGSLESVTWGSFESPNLATQVSIFESPRLSQQINSQVRFNSGQFFDSFDALGGVWSGGGCTCVKMEPFVLLGFFPQFYSLFRFKIGHFPFKAWCLGSRKGPFSGPKRTNGGFGVPRPQNQLKCL